MDDTIEGLIEENKLLWEVVEAARCIRHWHDNGVDGMVVSAEHVKALWGAIDNLDARKMRV